MPFIADRWQQVILDLSARRAKPVCKLLGKPGAKKRVVLGIEPQTWNARGLSEFNSRGDQPIACTIAVRFAGRVPSPATGEIDNSLDGRRFATCERDCPPASGRDTDDNGTIFFNERLRRHISERSLDTRRRS